MPPLPVYQNEPMPSMPIFFWGDDENMSRFRASHSRCSPVWHRADRVEMTERHTVIIDGRSDPGIGDPGSA